MSMLHSHSVKGIPLKPEVHRIFLIKLFLIAMISICMVHLFSFYCSAQTQSDGNKRKIFEGEVVSNKMNKTATVRILRDFRHPQYQKLIQKRTTCYVHDEKNEL